jgi:hypothetical protein
MRRGRLALSVVALAIGLTGCSQAGTPQVSSEEAAQIGVATGRITVACGTADELRAFGGPGQPGLGGEQSIAISGARKLAAVYRHDHSHIYQGESVGAVVHDSILLLGTCRLGRARRLLTRTLRSSKTPQASGVSSSAAQRSATDSYTAAAPDSLSSSIANPPVRTAIVSTPAWRAA